MPDYNSYKNKTLIHPKSFGVTKLAIILKELLCKPSLSAPPNKLYIVRKLAGYVTEGTQEIVGA
jgi:hypothetical protein